MRYNLLSIVQEEKQFKGSNKMARNAAGETVLQQKVVAMEHTGETEQKIKEITRLIETGHPVNVCDNAG